MDRKNSFSILAFLAVNILLALNSCTVQDEDINEAVYAPAPGEEPSYPYFNLPLIDLDSDIQRQVIIDREEGQYLGHPTTILLEDNMTMLCVYPKGHGRGSIVYKRSYDAGMTWTERLTTPESWETSKEVPTLFRTTDAEGKKRIIMFSGLYPTRMAVTEDDGISWSEIDSVGNWGGIVVMGAMAELKTGKGHYMAFFHDDMRFFTADGQSKYQADREQHESSEFTMYKT